MQGHVLPISFFYSTLAPRFGAVNSTVRSDGELFWIGLQNVTPTYEQAVAGTLFSAAITSVSFHIHGPFVQSLFSAIDSISRRGTGKTSTRIQWIMTGNRSCFHSRVDMEDFENYINQSQTSPLLPSHAHHDRSSRNSLSLLLLLTCFIRFV